MKIIALFFLSLCALTSAATSKKEVSVAFFEMAPHMYMEKGQPQGAVPEFLQKNVFANSEWKIKWRTYQFSRVLKALEMGRVDMAVMLVKNEERQKIFDFSEVSLFQSQSAIVVRKNFKVDKLTNLDVLKGLHLIHNMGTVPPKYFEPFNIRFEYISGEKSFDRSLQILTKGRADGFYVPLISEANYELQKRTDLKVLQIPREPFELFIAFRKGLNPQLIEKINAELKAHRGEYESILAKFYLPKSAMTISESRTPAETKDHRSN